MKYFFLAVVLVLVMAIIAALLFVVPDSGEERELRLGTFPTRVAQEDPAEEGSFFIRFELGEVVRFLRGIPDNNREIP